MVQLGAGFDECQEENFHDHRPIKVIDLDINHTGIRC